ncbi:MAG: FAD-binding oxidoreductase [Beutenbergiaceae bacterium]
MTLNPAATADLHALLGPDAVDTTAAGRSRSSHDTWPLSTKQARINVHPNQAEAVVQIASYDQVPAVLAIATQYQIPVTVRALGSSVTGQPLPVRGGIVLDVSAVPADFSVNLTDMTVTVSASFNGGDLEQLLSSRGLTTGHSPQSLYRSTVGGWVATLATGQFSSLYGGIEDLIVGYTVILATGEEVVLKASPRAAMGPDLRQVFIGSEGTLGVVTSVTLKLFPADLPTRLQTYSLPTLDAGLEVMREQALLGLRPYLIRFYDVDEARHAMQDPSVDTPIMFVGSRGVEELVEAETAVLGHLIEQVGGRSLGTGGVDAWMERRFDFSSVENLLATEGGFAETIEVAQTWSGIDALYADLKESLAPLADEVLAHFSHVYTQGTSMYLILLGKAETDTAAIARLQQIWDTAMAICLRHGAELSHHHGGGLARSPYARQSLGSAHLVLQKMKKALDPAGILNPGKLGL